MENDLTIEILKGSKIFSGLSEQQIKALLPILNIQELDDHQMLIEEGESSSNLFGIMEGMLEVTRRESAEEDIVLQVLRKGDIAGEMGFIDDQPHSASLRALGKTKVFSLAHDDFEAMVSEHPQIIYTVMKNIVKEVHNILRRMNIQYVQYNNYIQKRFGRY